MVGLLSVSKNIFDTLSNETRYAGLSFEKAAASRNVFSPTHMSPEKMISTLFAPAGANSARLF